MNQDRRRAAALGRETKAILDAGRYTATDGHVVRLRDRLDRAVAGTVSYPPEEDAAVPPAAGLATRIEVTDESTLAAARRMVASGERPAALNFASAKNPGGGFLSGARAQEESLARASGLFACLDGNPMYAHHRARRDALYTDYCIYSPEVPVFRDDDGVLLAEPYLCAFITSPAVNAKVVLERDPGRGGEIRDAMRRRIDKVLAVAARHRHESLVLGAWGCGVFRNDAEQIAELFRDSLAGRFAGQFGHVVFAILDRSKKRRFIGPFQRAFGAGEEDSPQRPERESLGKASGG